MKRVLNSGKLVRLGIRKSGDTTVATIVGLVQYSDNLAFNAFKRKNIQLPLCFDLENFSKNHI